MGKRVTFQLTTPIEGHDGKITSITLREPHVFEVLEIGDPFVVGTSPSGAQLVVENSEALTAYARRLIVEPANIDVLQNQGGVEMARGIKEAILGFFLPATDTDAASVGSQTTSPSAGSAPASGTSGS